MGNHISVEAAFEKIQGIITRIFNTKNEDVMGSIARTTCGVSASRDLILYADGLEDIDSLQVFSASPGDRSGASSEFEGQIKLDEAHETEFMQAWRKLQEEQWRIEEEIAQKFIDNPTDPELEAAFNDPLEFLEHEEHVARCLAACLGRCWRSSPRHGGRVWLEIGTEPQWQFDLGESSSKGHA